MSRLQLLGPSLTRSLAKSLRIIQRSSSSSTSSSSSSSDDEVKTKTKSEQKIKSEEALKKLNILLKTMIEDDVVASKAALNLAKPTNKRLKGVKKEDGIKSVKVESTDAQIANAVKDVAKSLGGDVKQTESELLMKLLKTSSEDKTGVTNLGELVKGMKIDKDPAVEKQTKAHQVRQALQASATRDKKARAPRTQLTETKVEKIQLFGGEPLGIFTSLPKDATEGVQNKTWDYLYQRDLKLAVTHPPKNYFEQMILWTEQGKVWKFPIDNEQGLEEENKVYFTEHVFLDKYQEPWCPAKGPLRHFMELVCVGLSKNPYLTVEAKREHIEWFRNYFEQKEQLLRDVGLIQQQESAGNQGAKQIES